MYSNCVFLPIPFAVNTLYEQQYAILKSRCSSLDSGLPMIASLYQKVHEQNNFKQTNSLIPVTRKNTSTMKKTITATLLFVALFTTAFAGGKDEQLANDLTNALKNSKQVSWTSTETHNRATFYFNGQTAMAYYDREDNALVGYSIHLSAGDLPATSQEAIAKKYPGWEITETIMFIDANGYTNHFVKVKKGDKSLALKVNDNKVNIFSRM